MLQQIIKGYKAFNSHLKCQNFQYKVGETYKIDQNKIKMCKSGFHFCRMPVDVLNYYRNKDDIYAIVEARDEIIDAYDKSVCSEITIAETITREQLFKFMPNEIIRINGDKEWYQNGKRHHTTGPAIDRVDGYKAWYQFGELHRIDGPAITYANGYSEWYQNGKLHRIDGPAIEGDVYKAWYKNGERQYQ